MVHPWIPGPVGFAPQPNVTLTINNDKSSERKGGLLTLDTHTRLAFHIRSAPIQRWRSQGSVPFGVNTFSLSTSLETVIVEIKQKTIIIIVNITDNLAHYNHDAASPAMLGHP